MFIGLGISAATSLRQFLAANWRAVGIGVAAIMAVVVALFASVLYRTTTWVDRDFRFDGRPRGPVPGHVEGYARVPIIGYGTPHGAEHRRVDGYPGLPVDLMFCFIFVGLALFLLFTSWARWWRGLE